MENKKVISILFVLFVCTLLSTLDFSSPPLIEENCKTMFCDALKYIQIGINEYCVCEEKFIIFELREKEEK